MLEWRIDMSKKCFLAWARALGLAMALICLGSCGKASKEKPLELSDAQKYAIWSLTCCAENSQTSFAYDYAENIDDGRGITFGIIGFTSGTYDGTMLLLRVKELAPDNPLVKYLPAFQAIDASPHGPNGCSDSTAGLAGFIEDFEAQGSGAAVKQAQLEKLDTLYWQPAIAAANGIGATSAITAGELYDACVNHGADGDDTDMGLKQLIEKTKAKAGGTPASGVDEKAWLRDFLSIRRVYLEGNWPDAVDRVDMYSRILESGNASLAVPFAATCYGDGFTIVGAEP
jgi:chitosanase